MPVSKFKFDLAGIGTVLETRQLSVPIYQRSYAWGRDDPKDRDQVIEFWTDLNSAFVQNQVEYFLGTIVLSQDGSGTRLTVIDGQQRLATTTVLLAAIRDTFVERGDTRRADVIQRDFLARSGLRSEEQVPNITLNADDDEFFQKKILGGATTQAHTSSEELIDRAYDILKATVSSTANDAGRQWVNRLNDWVEFLQTKAQVIVVEVPTESDAFLIFETLNDRGADLTIADLLKNYLFGQAGDRLDSVRNSWVSALANLDISAAGGQLFTDFLRHYWSSIHGATRERELYDRIKEKISSSTNAVEFATDLEHASRLYAAVLHADHEFWSEFDTGVRNNIAILGTLNLEQNRPLLLAAMQYLTQAELRETLRSLVSWSIRGLIVGGIGGGTAERVYCEAAMKIRAGVVKTSADIGSELSTITRSDEEFKTSFARARITRGPLARYLLGALERTMLDEPEPELVPNENEREVNLEHVLPRNPTASDWTQFTEEERRAYVHRIGNMALLSKGPNGKIGNSPFSVKRPVLAASSLLLTQEAGAEENWTPEVIAERQNKMADLAVKTWET